MRSDLALDRLDEHVESRRIDQPFLDEQGFERLDAQRQIRRHGLVVVIASVLRMCILPCARSRGADSSVLEEISAIHVEILETRR